MSLGGFKSRSIFGALVPLREDGRSCFLHMKLSEEGLAHPQGSDNGCHEGPGQAVARENDARGGCPDPGGRSQPQQVVIPIDW